MSTTLEPTLLDDLLDSIVACITPEAASRIIEMRAPPLVQQRFDELAERCNEGRLTPAEVDEYDALLRTLDLITLLQLKAQRLLDEVTDN